MSVDAEDIITFAGVLAGICSIFGAVFAAYRWYLRQNRDTAEIKRLKRENSMICYALSACLDGLIQLGANHSVPIAKEKLDKYLNQSAHDQLD